MAFAACDAERQSSCFAREAIFLPASLSSRQRLRQSVAAFADDCRQPLYCRRAAALRHTRFSLDTLLHY